VVTSGGDSYKNDYENEENQRHLERFDRYAVSIGDLITASCGAFEVFEFALARIKICDL
jgi:hypothetical protein